MKLVLMLTLAVILHAICVQAQTIPAEGTWGLRASIQSDNSVIMLPYRLSENTTISPALGLVWVEDESTTILIGAHIQRFLNPGSRFASYIGFKAGALHFSPDGGDSDTIFVVGPLFGGEVFLTPRISVGVEAGIDLELGGDENALSTTTGAFLTYYF